MVVRNCGVTKFWWGVYVQNAGDDIIEDNDLYENRWKDPTQNGNGYGLDVANSSAVTVRNNLISDNGNEGFHLSSSSASRWKTMSSATTAASSSTSSTPTTT